MAEPSKSRTSASDIEDQFKTIREDISRLTKLMTQFGEEFLADASDAAAEQSGDWINRSRRKAGETGRKVREKAASVEDYVVEKPVQSAVIALLIGLVLGSMSRR